VVKQPSGRRRKVAQVYDPADVAGQPQRGGAGASGGGGNSCMKKRKAPQGSSKVQLQSGMKKMKTTVEAL
jgi:hypothetical protein